MRVELVFKKLHLVAHQQLVRRHLSAHPLGSAEGSLEERGWGEKQKIHSLPPGPGRVFCIEVNLSVSTKEVGKWIIIIAISTHSRNKKIITIKP